MDREIRSTGPGKCPRCGMLLVAGIPDQTEYHLDLTVTPEAPPSKREGPSHVQVFDPRVWVQFQRNGVVNTAHFDVPVKAAESTAAS